MLGPIIVSATTARRGARVVIGLGLFVALATGCSQAESSPAASVSDIDRSNVTAAPQEPSTSDAGRLRAAIESAGAHTALPDDTLLAVVNGICRQLDAGTDRGTIVTNLRGIASAGAMVEAPVTNGGAGSAVAAPAAPADVMAGSYIDAAEQSNYC